MVLPGKDVPWGDFLRALSRESQRDNLVDYAASVAFSTFLSIFPFLLFAVGLASLFVDPADVASLVGALRRVAPPEAVSLIAGRLHALASGAPPALLTLSALGAIWAAAGAVAALITAFDAIYDIEETRPFWKTRGLAIMTALGLALSVVPVSLAALAAPALAHALGPLGAVVGWLRWPVAALVAMAGVSVLYRFLPNVRQSFREVALGAALAVAVWLAASLGLTSYVASFGHYEVVYGALGGVIALLLWLWVSALAVLLGAEVNAVLAQLASKREGGAAS